MRRSCSPGAETKMGLRPAARIGSINPSKNTHPKAGVTASTIGNEPAFSLLSWRCLRLIYIFVRSPTEEHIHVRARRLARSFDSSDFVGSCQLLEMIGSKKHREVCTLTKNVVSIEDHCVSRRSRVVRSVGLFPGQ